MSSSRRKSAAIALAVVGVAGLTLASAAQLNVGSASLGAGSDVVASCDTDGIDVDFVSSYVSGSYQTTGVTLSGVAPACDGLDVEVTLAGTAGALGDAADTVATGGATTISGLSADASAIEDVAVIIHG